MNLERIGNHLEVSSLEEGVVGEDFNGDLVIGASALSEVIEESLKEPPQEAKEEIKAEEVFKEPVNGSEGILFDGVRESLSKKESKKISLQPKTNGVPSVPHDANGKREQPVDSLDNNDSQPPQSETKVNVEGLGDLESIIGLSSLKVERDTIFSIAFVNPYIRRLLRYYKDDPFWSPISRKIIEICLSDNEDSWLDPEAVFAMIEGVSEAEKRRAISRGKSYLEVKTPADASVIAKQIVYRLKVSRIHLFMREYDNSEKTNRDVDTFLSRMEYVSKHYGVSMQVSSLLDISKRIKEEFEDLKVFPSFFSPLNKVLGYEGYLAGQLVTVAGAPARGKTTFLLNEAVQAALMGRNVLYFALADMTEEDLVVKVISILSGIRLVKSLRERYESSVSSPLDVERSLMDEIESYFLYTQTENESYYSPFMDFSPQKIITRGIKRFLDDPWYSQVISKIKVVVDSEARPHVEDIQSTVMSLEFDPDVVMIDYDRSVKARTTEGLYHEGEEIYEGLVSIAKPRGGKKRLVFVASQINKAFWSKSHVPLEALAESSRKQAISDIVITIGRDFNFRGVHVGTVALEKNRRGATGAFGYILLPTNQLYPFDLEEINRERAEEVKRKIRKSKGEDF